MTMLRVRKNLNRWMTGVGSLVMMNLKLNKIEVEASVEIARQNSPGLSFPTPNAKATSVCDDNYEADTASDDNAKVDDRSGFTRDDEPEVEQDRSGASDRASVGAKVE
nr:hypothetical protein [Tanacetum cinerariifolium]